MKDEFPFVEAGERYVILIEIHGDGCDSELCRGCVAEKGEICAAFVSPDDPDLVLLRGAKDSGFSLTLKEEARELPHREA